MASVPARVTQPVDLENLVTLQGNTHPLARPEFDQGAAPDSLPIRRILLVLQRSPDQEIALRKLLDEQQIKSSPNYHMWLTPEQFGEQFGPADADIQAVTDWLTSQGFQVSHVAAGRTVIEFSGTAGAVRQAFHTEIHKYVVNGKERWANASDPQIPAALTPVAAGLASLNNFPRQAMYRELGVFERSKKTSKIQPLFTYPCPSPLFGCELDQMFYGLGPTDLAIIYNILPLWNASPAIDGTGETIAIVADSNIDPQDVANFRNVFALPAYSSSCPNAAPCLNIILNGPDPGPVGDDEIEADLDAEWAGAVAKNATIDLVVSEDTEATQGADLSALYIIDNNLAPILSESFGACEANLGNAGNAFENAMFEQAAAEGITVITATGDSGSATCDNPGDGYGAAQYGLAVNATASTPFEVAVGGTDFDNPSAYFSTTSNPTTQASAQSYAPEITWNDSCAASGDPSACALIFDSNGLNLTAGGGGESNCATTAGGVCTGYAKPAWQTGAGVPQDGVRDLPDISLFASNGMNNALYIVCASSTSGNPLNIGQASCGTLPLSSFEFLGVGGTSVSAQAFAGIMALVDQKAGQRQGNANFVLYPLAAAAAKSGAYCASNASAVTDTSCLFYNTNAGHDDSGNTISPGNNSVECYAGSPNCSATSGSYGILINPNDSTPTAAWTTNAGYNMATGLGTVNVANLVNNWGTVSFQPSATALNLSPVTLTHGQPVSVNVSVTSSAGTPTGNVALMGNPATAAHPSGTQNSALAAFTLGSNGSVSGTTNLLPGGTYEVFAHYAGDGTFGWSDSAPLAVTVNPEQSETTLQVGGCGSPSAPCTFEYGAAGGLRVNVLNSAGAACAPANSSGAQYFPVSGCPTGTVTWTDNGAASPASEEPFAPAGTTPGTLVLNSQGYAEDQFLYLTPGSHTLLASYGGDNSFLPSASSPVNLTVTKGSTFVNENVQYLSGGGPATVYVGVYKGASYYTGGVNLASLPTGTVQVFSGTTPLGSPTPCTPPYANYFFCEASVAITLDATASLVAQYSGDSNYSGGASSPLTITITPAFALSALPTTSNVSPGGSTRYTITATGSPAWSSGSVDFICSVSAATGIQYPPVCSLNPSVITLGTNPGTTTLTVSTTAPSVVVPVDQRPSHWPAMPMLLLGGLLLLGAAAYQARARRRPLAGAALAGLLLLSLLGLARCGGSSGSGGGGGNPGTPAGTYTITVTGASGTVTSTAQVTLTVQ
jgi:hypothetical protein